jgi:hypothetical protein
MPTKTKARTPDGEIVALPAYQADLIAKINALPPLDRANIAGSIACFCFAAAEGFKAGAARTGEAA